MSNKNKNHTKKWLISRLKTSGSKRRYVGNKDYADSRNSKSNSGWENLPIKEGMGKSLQFFNGKINYGLLVRFLRTQVGNDWKLIQAEISQRIPTDLLEYQDCVKWFVADLVEKSEYEIWDKRAQKILKTSSTENTDRTLHSYKEFYVDPETNILIKVNDFPSRKQTKGLNSENLRKFRESEQKEKQEENKQKKIDTIRNKKAAKEILMRDNKPREESF